MISIAAALIEPVNEYVTQAWTNAFKKLGIETHTSKSGDTYLFLYQDYDTYDFETRDQQAQWVYSYIYRKALTRKNYLCNTILHYRAKRPNSILHSAWPDSFNLELDFAEFLDDALDESWDLKQELEGGTKTWILKPALGERAHGIHIFKSQEDLQEIFNATQQDEEDEEDEAGNGDAPMRQYVVQEYITNPLLIDSRKFHLRVYCLCVGKLTVYVNTNILTLFSTVPYDSTNMKDLSSHLTNTCFQGESAKVSLLAKELPASQCQQVTEEVCAVVHDLFEAAEGDPINFQSLPNALEFYGLDFLVTSDSRVKLLEVNAYPDFKQTGAELRFVVDDMFAEAAALVFKGEASRNLREVYRHEKLAATQSADLH